MKIGTFRLRGSEPQPGVIAGDAVIPIAAVGYPDVLSIIAGGAESRAAIESLLETSPAAVPLADVKLDAPYRPPKLIGVGLNYRDHAIESKMEIPSVPTIFNKFPQCVIGPGETVILPKATAKPDYEAEFAFLIGKRGKNIPAEAWQEYVYGYTIMNDVSARDLQLATSQWLMGKTCDTFAPLGPYVVTADEIADPHNLDISIEVSGEKLQDSNTKHLIFRIPELIAFLSSSFTLEPGDLISTGTPAGVGFAHQPPRWLRAGDVMTVRVEGLGELTNPVAVEI